MKQPLVCMTLTGKTLSENAETVKRYSRYIDMVEIRADYLDEEECLHVKRFPDMINIPCVLTIRRRIDGGLFTSGESSRTMLFARALAFAAKSRKKNFAYVDFEDDFYVPSLQDAALAFGIKVIRSFHDMNNPVLNIKAQCAAMRKTGYEIPKIAFMPKTLSDVTNLFREAETMTDSDHILLAMGPLGLPTRILASKLNSYLTFVSPKETLQNTSNIGHIDPVTLSTVYQFSQINEDTEIFGVTGWPLTKTRSPEIHNAGYAHQNMNKVFIPLRSQTIEDALLFAEQVGVKGFAVTVPFKEQVIGFLSDIDEETKKIGACNTIKRTDDGWIGRNTDAGGFRQSLEEFLGVKKLRRKKVAIIGAGGAARAIAYVIKAMGAKACIFNRTVAHAKKLADVYGFKYAPLEPRSLDILENFSDIIIQTTTVGMNATEKSNEHNDPIYFYRFRGDEKIFDIIYTPEITPVMARAKEAGCAICNGMKMLEYQGHRQFKFFTGADYSVSSDINTGNV